MCTQWTFAFERGVGERGLHADGVVETIFGIIDVLAWFGGGSSGSGGLFEIRPQAAQMGTCGFVEVEHGVWRLELVWLWRVLCARLVHARSWLGCLFLFLVLG